MATPLSLLSSNFSSLPACMSVTYIWSGGTPPYTLSISPSGNHIALTKAPTLTTFTLNLNQTNYTLTVPQSPGTNLLLRISDNSAIQQTLSSRFTILNDEEVPSCLPSNGTLDDISSGGDVVSYPDSTFPKPSLQFNVKQHGIASTRSLRSSSLVEVEIMSIAGDHVTLILMPESQLPLPIVGWGFIGPINVTIPIPFPPGVVFAFEVAFTGNIFNSEPFLVVTGDSAACVVSNGTSLVSNTILPIPTLDTNSTSFPSNTSVATLDAKENSDFPKGAIAGVIVGALLLLVVILFLLSRLSKQQKHGISIPDPVSPDVPLDPYTENDGLANRVQPFRNTLLFPRKFNQSSPISTEREEMRSSDGGGGTSIPVDSEEAVEMRYHMHRDGGRVRVMDVEVPPAYGDLRSRGDANSQTNGHELRQEEVHIRK